MGAFQFLVLQPKELSSKVVLSIPWAVWIRTWDDDKVGINEGLNPFGGFTINYTMVFLHAHE